MSKFHANLAHTNMRNNLILSRKLNLSRVDDEKHKMNFFLIYKSANMSNDKCENLACIYRIRAFSCFEFYLEQLYFILILTVSFSFGMKIGLQGKVNLSLNVCSFTLFKAAD